MPLLLPEPEAQFCDADGNPYAAGTIDTFVPGTSTPKATWQDKDGAALNTNPIVLDAAGRAIIFGDGDYRFVLKDAAGNLIYDQWTSSVVSVAMQPVVAAPTIAEAQRLLGISDVAAETARAEAAEAALGTRIDNEVTRATNAETSLRNDLNAEIARAEAAEANLQAQIDGVGGGTTYAQIYTRHQQVTTLTVNVPTGKGAKMSIGAAPGTMAVTDGGGTTTTYSASGTLNRDGLALARYGYISDSDPPLTGLPLPPAFPWGWIDVVSAGSHTYTMNYYIHPDVTGWTGVSDWPANFSGNADCYIYIEFI
jgi:hypothetical protein